MTSMELEDVDLSEYEEEIMILELNGVLDAESVRNAVKTNAVIVRKANSSDPLVQVTLVFIVFNKKFRLVHLYILENGPSR